MNPKRVHVSCNKDCGAGCPLTAEVSGGRITRIIDNPAKGPFMRGCAKGHAMHLLLDHPHRLLQPLMQRGKRGSETFQAVSWEEALDCIAKRLHELREQGRIESVMRIGGSGSCRGAVHHTARLAARFLSGLGRYTNTAGNYSSEAATFMKPLLLGRNDIGIDIRTLLKSKLIILLGFNPSDTRFGCETEGVLMEVKRRRIPVVIIDPRRTASADLCNADWLPIHPGTDSVLLASLAYEVLAQDARLGLEVHSIAEGFPDILSWMKGEPDGITKDAQWAAGICGIAPGRIRELAQAMVRSRPAALLPGLSVQRTLAGEEADRMGLVLQVLLGNIGVKGGSAGCGQWNRGPSVPVETIPEEIAGSEAPASVPVYQWADTVLDRTRRHPISFIYNVGGNFMSQSSNLALVKKALETVDFVVSHEHFMTATCRFSDVVLPASMFLERSDLCTSNSGLLFYSAQAAAPAGEVRNDYDIFCDLARKLGYYQSYSLGRDSGQWVEHILAALPEEARNACLERGFWEIPQRPFVGLDAYINDPQGSPLPTPSGKIELNPPAYQQMTGSRYPVVQRRITTKEFPLHLITPHERQRIHSQLNCTGLAPEDCLLMHPEDASQRGIADGSEVSVSSSVGCFHAVVKLTGNIIRGVVSKNSGPQPEIGEDGSLAPCGNPNMATSSEPTFPSRGSRTHSNAVEVTLS